MAVKQKKTIHHLLDETYLQSVNDVQKSNGWTLPNARFSEKQLEPLLQKYPELAEQKEQLLYSVFSALTKPWRDKKTGDELAPCNQIATFMGKFQRHCKTKTFFEDRQDIFFLFKHRDYHHQEHEVRRILRNGLTKQDKWGVLSVNNRQEVCFSVKSNGIEIIEKEDRKAYEKHRASCQKKTKCTFKSQTPITEYHHTQDLMPFYELRNQNYDDAFAAAKAKGDEAMLIFLQGILASPGISFDPSRERETARLFDETGFWGMKQYAKDIYFRGCFDIDMKHCHITAIAHVLHIPAFLELLKENKDIWKILVDFLEVPDWYYEGVKSGVKTVTYQTVYGMRANRAQLLFTLFSEEAKSRMFYGKKMEKTMQEKYGYSIKGLKKLIDHPLLVTLRKAVRKQLHKIKKDQGMYAANGKWIFCPIGEKPERVLACVMQSYEQFLISGVYELALQERADGHERFSIVNHQFDGITIKVHDGEDIEAITRDIAKAINKKAKQIHKDMYVKVECKELGLCHQKAGETTITHTVQQFTPNTENTPNESTPEEHADDSQNEKSMPENNEEMSFLAFKKQFSLLSCAEDDAEMCAFFDDDEDEEGEYDLLE